MIDYLIHSFMESGKWFAICFALFVPLAYMFAGNRKQPILRRGMVADSLYWFLGPLLYHYIYSLIFALVITVGIYNTDAFEQLTSEGFPPLATLPLWLQVLLILLITDILQYWAHRLFHHNPLWKFHAVHHSTINLDWLSAARFHPVNIILYSTIVNAFVILLGFDPKAFWILLPFNTLYSPLVHANLNWTYGPFKYVLASPVFHRWHHTLPSEGGNKNFAPTFPFIDLIFGTFYMPKDTRPLVFGTEGDHVPESFIGQLVYPFRKR